MKIRILVVGIDHFHDLTHPFLEGLCESNKGAEIVLIDNASAHRYGDHAFSTSITCILHTIPRMGYGAALNNGAEIDTVEPWDWLLCCNNDCLCEGNVTEIIKKLDTGTVWGNDWKFDYDGMRDGLPAVVDSAFFLIPRRIWDAIGPFDPEMDAAFEEVDYCIRALDAGFRVDVAPLPIVHLNMHTRKELQGYDTRWEASRQKFRAKHPSRKEHGNANNDRSS